MVVRTTLYGAVSLFLGLVLWFALWQPVQVLPRGNQMPAFTLKDQQDHWLSDSELRGQIVLLSFGYSRCGQGCETTTKLMQAVDQDLQRTGRGVPPISLLTVSLDVPYDTPDVLHTYAQRIGADGQTWRMLSGEAAETKLLAGGGFSIYYEQPGTDAPVAIRDHKLVLIDQNGLIRAEYSGSHLDLQRLQRDFALLQKEASSDDLFSRSVYEAAHLFVCYAD